MAANDSNHNKKNNPFEDTSPEASPWTEEQSPFSNSHSPFNPFVTSEEANAQTFSQHYNSNDFIDLQKEPSPSATSSTQSYSKPETINPPPQLALLINESKSNTKGKLQRGLVHQ